MKEAEKLLRSRLAAISTGTYVGPKLEKVPVSELADDLVREYRINGRKSIHDLEARWALHLKPFFGILRAVEITSQLVARYIDARQQEGAENATINRELAALKRMFNLARQSTPPKVNTVPYIAMLREDNIRTGFLESKQHDSLASETGKIGLWLRALFETGYTYGWRHEELLALRVRQVNLSSGTIRLEPGTTKNDQGREVSMTLPVRALLTQCVNGKGPDDYVFTREDGKPVRDFRRTWAKACEAAKVPGLLFHDLRRNRSAESTPCWSRRRSHHEDRRLENPERVRTLRNRFAIRHSRCDGKTRGRAATRQCRSGPRAEFIRRAVWSEFGQNRTQYRRS